jgi:hypothetical protein
MLKTWWNFRRAVNAAVASADGDAVQNDIAVIPCWRRPEFLWHCLDNLARSQDICELSVVVRPDTGFAPENLQVVEQFKDRLPHLSVQFPVPTPYRRTKQSANVLLGCLRAAANARRFVFLIEEDIMVARDYFRWHRQVHSAAAAPLFCSIAVDNPNRHLTLPDDISGFYLSSGDYCSPGVCFNRSVLLSRVAPHISMAYMAKPKKYVQRHFPESRIGLGFVEQDGLVRRIQETSERPIAWPCVGRAFHAGFYGYNRPGGVAGSLEQRIRELAAIIYDPVTMQAAETQSGFPNSCPPTPLELPDWVALHRVSVPDP